MLSADLTIRKSIADSGDERYVSTMALVMPSVSQIIHTKKRYVSRRLIRRHSDREKKTISAFTAKICGENIRNFSAPAIDPRPSASIMISKSTAKAAMIGRVMRSGAKIKRFIYVFAVLKTVRVVDRLPSFTVPIYHITVV